MRSPRPSREGATEIAFLVRRFELMALPGLRGAPLDQLLDRLQVHAEVGAFSLVDVSIIVGAEEIDRVCAAGLVRLRDPTAPAAKAGVLDVLAVCDELRKVALYFALPVNQRGTVERHPAFANIVQPWRDEMDAALFDLAELIRILGSEMQAALAGDPDRLARWIPLRFRSLLRDDALARPAG